MRFATSVDDIMIILGDAGINFSGGFKDQAKKDYIAAMPITLFCIHGNHEQRTFSIPSYEETKMDWKVDVVLSHTAPLKYEPVEVFLSGVDQSRVDKFDVLKK